MALVWLSTNNNTGVQVIDVLSKLAGLWINTNKLILYSQATHIRWCIVTCNFPTESRSSSLYLLHLTFCFSVLLVQISLWMESYWINKLFFFSFICPMSFDKFPLDEQRCMFKVGSYSYDNTKMVFVTERTGYNAKESNSIALDYEISKRSVSQLLTDKIDRLWKIKKIFFFFIVFVYLM